MRMRILKAVAVLLAAAFGAAAVAAAVEGPGGSGDDEAERVTTVTGTLQVEGKDVRLGARKVGLGPPWYRETAKAADFDGDGTVETIARELAGLEGRSVAVTGELEDDQIGARAIAGKPYRQAGKPPWAGGKNRAAKCEAKQARQAAKQKDRAGRGGPPPWAKAHGFRRRCS